MEVLTQELPIAMAEQPAIDLTAELSLRDRILGSRVGNAAVALITGLGIGGAGELAMTPVASANQVPVAHVSSHTWSVLGGDPFKAGGIKTRDQLAIVLESSRGRAALRGEGLNTQQINAVENAVSRKNRKKDVTNCTLNPGDHFKAMAFGAHGEIENDVKYTGPSAPAFCINVEAGGKKIELKIPLKCVNIALEKEAPLKPKPHKPHKTHHQHKKPQTPVTPATPNVCSGNTTNTNSGNAAQGGNCSTNTNIPICSPVSSPNSVICSPVVIEQPPVVTPPPSPQRPSIVMENMPSEGGFIGDKPQFCAEATSNPTADGVTVAFTDKYNMPMTGTYADPNGDPNSYCVTETFTALEPDEQIYATATDKVDSSQTASATSNPFSIRQSTGF
jgi:hypothetical protein